MIISPHMEGEIRRMALVRKSINADIIAILLLYYCLFPSRCWSRLSLTCVHMRRNNTYIQFARRVHGQTQKARSKTAGTQTHRHPHPAAVSDTLFRENPFFDSKDLLQVRYEMLRRHRVEGASVVAVSSTFGISRPTFYQAQIAFGSGGLTGLLPKQRGPKQGHKLSDEIVEYVRNLKTSSPGLTTVECIKTVEKEFGITVHRRSLERAMAGKKKLRKST
jgi:transposase